MYLKTLCDGFRAINTVVRGWAALIPMPACCLVASTNVQQR
jgi:hypothetical protein